MSGVFEFAIFQPCNYVWLFPSYLMYKVRVTSQGGAGTGFNPPQQAMNAPSTPLS